MREQGPRKNRAQVGFMPCAGLFCPLHPRCGLSTTFAFSLPALRGRGLPDLSRVFVALPGHDKAARVDQMLSCPLITPPQPQAGPPWQ